MTADAAQMEIQLTEHHKLVDRYEIIKFDR